MFGIVEGSRFVCAGLCIRAFWSSTRNRGFCRKGVALLGIVLFVSSAPAGECVNEVEKKPNNQVKQIANSKIVKYIAAEKKANKLASGNSANRIRGIIGDNDFPVEKLPPKVNAFIDRVLGPVLLDRSQFADFTFSIAEGKEPILTITTFGFRNDPDLFIDKSPLSSLEDPRLVYSTYTLKFSSARKIGIPSSLPGVKLHIEKNKHVKTLLPLNVSGEIVIPTNTLKKENWELWRNQVRSLVTADPYLHPFSPIQFQKQLISMLENLRRTQLETKIRLAPPQQEAIQQLLEIEDAFAGKSLTGVQKYGLIMPVGIGKTITSSIFLTKLVEMEKLKRPTKIVVVYQNIAALRQMQRFFTKRLNLTAKDFHIMYGPEQDGDVFTNKKFKVLLASRSSYHANMGTIHKFITDETGFSWFFLMDEAHHLGTYEGQFDDIFFGTKSVDGLNDILTIKDRILMLTATPWHKDTNIIQKYMDGNIAAPFLTPEEYKTLSTTNDLKAIQELTRIQFFRAIEQGYSSPINTFVEHHYTNDGQKIASILNDSISELKKVDTEDEAIAILRTHITIYEEVVDFMIKLIVNNRVPFQYDHGIIYAPTIAHANIYAFLLNQRFKRKDMSRPIFRAYHSKLQASELEGIEDWFFHEGNVNRHQYIIAVAGLQEAIDIPMVNLLLNSRPFLEFRALEQVMGRGTRIFPGKPGIRLIDLTDSFSHMIRPELKPAVFSHKANIEKQEPPKKYELEAITIVKSGVDTADFVANDQLANWKSQVPEIAKKQVEVEESREEGVVIESQAEPVKSDATPPKPIKEKLYLEKRDPSYVNPTREFTLAAFQNYIVEARKLGFSYKRHGLFKKVISEYDFLSDDLIDHIIHPQANSEKRESWYAEVLYAKTWSAINVKLINHIISLLNLKFALSNGQLEFLIDFLENTKGLTDWSSEEKASITINKPLSKEMTDKLDRVIGLLDSVDKTRELLHWFEHIADRGAFVEGTGVIQIFITFSLSRYFGKRELSYMRSNDGTPYGAFDAFDILAELRSAVSKTVDGGHALNFDEPGSKIMASSVEKMMLSTLSSNLNSLPDTVSRGEYLIYNRDRIGNFSSALIEHMLSEDAKGSLLPHKFTSLVVETIAQQEEKLDDGDIQKFVDLLPPLTPVTVEITKLFRKIADLTKSDGSGHQFAHRRENLLTFVSKLTFYDFHESKMVKEFDKTEAWKFFEVFEELIKLDEFSFKQMEPFFVSMIRGTDKIEMHMVVMSMMQKYPKMFKEVGQTLFNEISRYSIAHLHNRSIFYVMFLLKAQQMQLKVNPAYVYMVEASLNKSLNKMEKFLDNDQLFNEIWKDEFISFDYILGLLNEAVVEVDNIDWINEIISGTINNYVVFLRDLQDVPNSTINRIISHRYVWEYKSKIEEFIAGGTLTSNQEEHLRILENSVFEGTLDGYARKTKLRKLVDLFNQVDGIAMTYYGEGAVSLMTVLDNSPRIRDHVFSKSRPVFFGEGAEYRRSIHRDSFRDEYLENMIKDLRSNQGSGVRPNFLRDTRQDNDHMRSFGEGMLL